MIDRDDFIDIGLHIAGALIFMGIVSSLARMPGLAVIVNSGFWPLRELVQRHAKGQPWTALFTRPQVLAEWAAPVATGVLYDAVLR